VILSAEDALMDLGGVVAIAIFAFTLGGVVGYAIRAAISYHRRARAGR
jgi:hypothetical protein